MANAPDPIAESIIMGNAEIAKAERIRAAAPRMLALIVLISNGMVGAATLRKEARAILSEVRGFENDPRRAILRDVEGESND